MRTLIAEDDAVSRTMLRDILSKWGHEVLIAENGVQAWEVMRRDNAPMLAILDWMMPELDGLEVCRRIRNHKKVNPPYIIILSGKSEKADIIQGLDEGANDYLVKPVDFGELHARVGVGRRMLELQSMLVGKIKESWESRQLLGRTFAALDDAIFVIDSKTQEIMDCNQAASEIFGYSRAQLLGKNTAFLHVDQASFQEFNEYLHSAAHEKKSLLQPEFGMKRKDGGIFPTEHGVTLLTDERGRRIGWVSLVRDITRRKEAEMREKAHQEQLLRAAKMAALGTLVAGVAHEVNNPNNFIMLNAPLLEKVWKDSLPVLEKHHRACPDFALTGIPFEQMRGYVSELFSGLHEGSKRIKHIVAELKNFARQSPLDMSGEVQLNQVVEAALTMLRKTIAQHTSHFSVSLDPHLPLVRGDFQKLEQVVVNLLINACQALPDKNSSISLETFHAASETSAGVRIIDQGEGIPRENLGRICDPFFSTRQDIGGTGLGLAISLAVIQDHAGQMLFDSAPGVGTTVTVILKALA